MAIPFLLTEHSNRDKKTLASTGFTLYQYISGVYSTRLVFNSSCIYIFTGNTTFTNGIEMEDNSTVVFYIPTM